MKLRVVECARQDGDGLPANGFHHRLQLPESEMAGDEQDALALRVRLTAALFAVELDARQHLRIGERAELEQLEQQASEMREGAARDRAALGVGPRGKREREVPVGHAPMHAVNRVERQSDERPASTDERPGHHAHERD